MFRIQGQGWDLRSGIRDSIQGQNSGWDTGSLFRVGIQGQDSGSGFRVKIQG
jgi:hypothetical protein